MQLVLLSTINPENGQIVPFLSNAFSYKYDSGKFIPQNVNLANNVVFDNSDNFDNTGLHGSIFNRCSISKCKIFNEKIVILRGLSNLTSEEVFICFFDNNFENFSNNTEEDKILMLKNYICGGKVGTLTFYDILLSSLEKSQFTITKFYLRAELPSTLTFETLDVENDNITTIEVVSSMLNITESSYLRGIVVIWAKPNKRGYDDPKLCLCNASLFERDNDGTLVTSDRNIMNILTSEARHFLDPELFKTIFTKFYRISSSSYNEDILIIVGKTTGGTTKFLATTIKKYMFNCFVKYQNENPVLALENSIWETGVSDSTPNQMFFNIISRCILTQRTIGPQRQHVVFTCYDEYNTQISNIYCNTKKISNYNSNILINPKPQECVEVHRNV
ncbi:hypothetical protein EHRUM4_05130 [Ehrlichia ruminantium]|uniref:Uncharacterized protein n=2 Tax=Ehrlichia ruminantium TaxID=779 RepID=A0A161LYN4_EHRRU|nr:hypothetical protein [Ehrlichia ruminantium]GAT75297.1 hypothetical protein EHRUM4_05130 [Ehrlichia ruminantium]GAT77290.1 hypothetical protein EHRUM2_05090 [Ehrlichia ruminantium]